MLNKITKIIIIFFINLIGLIFFSTNTYATNILFRDDFSNLADFTANWKKTSYQLQGSNWSIIDNSTHWEILNQELVTHIANSKIASTIMTGDSNWNNYFIEIDIYMVQGVDLGIWFRSTDFFNRYSLNPRFPLPTDSTTPGLRLDKVENGKSTLLKEIKYPFKHNQWYKIKLSCQDSYIQVWINGIFQFDYFDQNNILKKGKIGLQGWSGSLNYINGKFDNLIVTEIPEGYYPIILLPGLGASWNLGGLFADKTVGTWTKTPFVNIYDNLKNTLITNAGYQDGVNYFEYYYDWRKPLTILADEFKQYLDSIPSLQNQKVNLVGHSLGGLLARTYAQKYGLDKINQIITIGSPHEGVVQTYNAWEGGLIDDNINWGSLTLQLLLNSKRNSFQTTADAVKTLAPSLQNILPIFNYLKINDTNQIIPVENLIEKNNLLGELKNSISQDLKNIMSTIYGVETNPTEDTLEWLKIQSPNWLEKILGLWPDGKPVAKEISILGDLTVLKKSATISGVFAMPEVSGNHSDIISSTIGVQTILNQLGMTHVTPITNSSNINRPALLFFLHSPATILITAPDTKQAGNGASNLYPNAIYSPDDKLVLLLQAPNGDYTIKLIGTKSGDFDLDIIQLGLTQTEMSTITNKISKDEEQVYVINFIAASPIPNPLKDDTGEIFLQMAKQKLVNIESFTAANIADYPTQKRIRYSLQQSIKNAQSALTNLKSSNYLNASKTVLSLLTDNYLWRRDDDSYYKNNKLEFDSLTFINNGLKETNDYLAQAWLKIYQLAGKTISSSSSLSYRNAAQQLVATNETKLKAKTSIINKPLGNSFTWANNYLQQASTYYAAKFYEACYIYALMSRNLSSEVTDLMK